MLDAQDDTARLVFELAKAVLADRDEMRAQFEARLMSRGIDYVRELQSAFAELLNPSSPKPLGDEEVAFFEGGKKVIEDFIARHASNLSSHEDRPLKTTTLA